MTKTMDYSQRYKKDREAKMWNTSKVIFLLLGMTAVGLVLMFPYVFMINKSLMSTDEILDPNPHFFPIWSALQWDNYVKLFTEAHSDFNYGTALLHTLEIILFNVIAIPLSASMIAFSFAKLRWKGRNAVFALMMLTITLPGVVTQIPLYVIYSKIGWLNTLLPFTIPNLFGGGAMYIFLIRQYMTDPWVLSKHIELFTMAGIDYLCLDATNSVIYEDSVHALLSVILKYQAQGWKTPKLMFYTNSASGSTIKRLYNAYYTDAQYDSCWFAPAGKPRIVGVTTANNKASDQTKYSTTFSDYVTDDMLQYFDVKESEWPNGDFNANSQPWMSWVYPQTIHGQLQQGRLLPDWRYSHGEEGLPVTSLDWR